MQISSHTAICSPHWEADQGYWLPLNISKTALSDEARFLFVRLQAIIPEEISVYVRGSVIESARPFSGSDLDLFLVLPEKFPLPVFPDAAFITRRELDVKVIRYNALNSDKVLYSLLAHRSLHVCGPVLHLAPVKADFDFAWQHWLKYCPAALPNELSCDSRYSVILMKQLIRSFGVLMFLEDNRFTRDISECISYSFRIDDSLPGQLTDLRMQIEKSSSCIYRIGPIKKSLLKAFDRLFLLTRTNRAGN